MREVVIYDGFRMPVKRDDAEAALAILNRLQTESEKGKHLDSSCLSSMTFQTLL